MLKLLAIGFAAAPIYSDYPGFLKRDALVQAYTDLGPIVELVVRCPEGTGIISYSKVERVYCSSKFKCYAAITPAVQNTCGGSIK